jgi:HAE1 family hydrophobic/amphiphilic exporter-1
MENMEKQQTENRETAVPKSADLAYLQKLEFNPELRKSWFNFFVTNFRVVILLILLLTGWGVFAYVRLPLESNPEIKIPVAVITATFPGASPADVEELVTKKIETDIAGITGIDKVTSTSANSFSAVTVEFDANQNLNDAIRRLRDQLPKIRTDIPAEADDPQVIEISFDNTPIVIFELTGPYDGFTMRNYADNIQDELEKIPGVREARISGGDEDQFEVAYDPQKLTFYGITLEQANQAISVTNRAVPSGNFEGNEFNYPVRTDARFFDAESLGNIPVKHTANGGLVYLKDIARVQKNAIKKTVLSRFSSGGEKPQNAISIQIVKRTGSSILDTVEASEKTIQNSVKNLPAGINYVKTLNQAERIRQDLDQLTHDFIFTLILVVGVLILIVGVKEAFVAGLAIPLVFFATFGVMLLTGITLNFLSIFSLLLSLGLLVDDAIVVVSATKQYMKTGKYTPEEAVLLVLNDFKIVLTTTTLATIWAFLPLLMSTGIIGQFIKSIPITVSVTLFASLLIALMINHPLAAVLERIRLTRRFFWLIVLLLMAAGALGAALHSLMGYVFIAIDFLIILWMLSWYAENGKEKLKENEILLNMEWKDDELIKKKLLTQGDHESASLADRLIHGIIHFDRVLPIYEKYLRLILSTRKRRWAVILGTLALLAFSISLPITGIVKTEFFPASNEDTISISLRGPSGLRLSEMDKITAQIEERLFKYPGIVSFSTLVGNPGVREGDLSVTQNTSNTASISLKLTPTTDKKRPTSGELADKIRADLSDIREATVTVSAPGGGPPAGAAFQAQISGDDLQTLDKIANELKPILDSITGVINSDISLKEATADYTFKLDPVKMEFYGLNATSVGATLRTAISGVKISTVILENKDIDVTANFKESTLPDLESIQNLQILNNAGQSVYLKDIAKIELVPSVESIMRIDQKRTVVLTSDVTGDTTSVDVLAEFQKKLKENYEFPEGYSITYGGENEQNTESVQSILRAMIIAAILIISTMVIQFNSFRKAFIVLVTLPLALIGVFLGLAITGIHLSFPGLIGILALFGIVVKNAIILIDKINLNIEIGIPFFDSVVDAGKSRLEAIFITSICTIFGIVPVTLSNDLWRALGSAIIFGLMLSSFLTLFLVPTLFVTMIKEEK